MKIGVPAMLRKVLKSKPKPIAVIQPKPDAYEPVSLPGLLLRIRSHGDRGARRWAREVSRRTSSLPPRLYARSKKRNHMARDSRRRNRS